MTETLHVFKSTYVSKPALVVHSKDIEDMDAWDRVLSRTFHLEGIAGGADVSVEGETRVVFTYGESLTATQAFALISDAGPGFSFDFEETDTSGRARLPKKGRVAIEWSEIHPGDEDPQHRYDWDIVAEPKLGNREMCALLGIVRDDLVGTTYLGPRGAEWSSATTLRVSNGEAPEAHQAPELALRDFAQGWVDPEHQTRLDWLYEALDQYAITAWIAEQEVTVPAYSTPDYAPMEMGVSFRTGTRGDIVRHDYFEVSSRIDSDEWRRTMRGLVADLQSLPE